MNPLSRTTKIVIELIAAIPLLNPNFLSKKRFTGYTSIATSSPNIRGTNMSLPCSSRKIINTTDTSM